MEIIDTLQNEINTLHAENDVLHSKVDSYDAEIDALHAEVDSNDDDINTINDSITKLLSGIVRQKKVWPVLLVFVMNCPFQEGMVLSNSATVPLIVDKHACFFK